jgi:hypothetical protein
MTGMCRRARFRRALYLAILVALVGGCGDSAGPPEGKMVVVQGEVIEGEATPTSPLDLTVRVWAPFTRNGEDFAGLHTDGAGRYTATFGPFEDASVDSVVIRVFQDDCGFGIVERFGYQNLAADDAGTIEIPVISLDDRLTSPELAQGTAMCAAVVTRNSVGEVFGYPLLALWLDLVGTGGQSGGLVVQGRWQLDDFTTRLADVGYFTGAAVGGRLRLELRPASGPPEDPYQPSCTTIDLDLALGGPNGRTIGVGEVVSEGEFCFLSDRTVRFETGSPFEPWLEPTPSD